MQTLCSSSRVDKFKYAEKITNRKKEGEERFRLTLSLWLNYWRDVLVCACGSSAPLVNVDRRPEIEALASRLGMPGARRQVEGTEAAIQRLDDNVNTRLLAEGILLDLPSIRS
jgi:DNA polymerase-3 subunit delta'